MGSLTVLEEKRCGSQSSPCWELVNVGFVWKVQLVLKGTNSQKMHAWKEFFPRAIGFVTALPHVWGCSNLVLRFGERFR